MSSLAQPSFLWFSTAGPFEETYTQDLKRIKVEYLIILLAHYKQVAKEYYVEVQRYLLRG